MTGNNEMSSSAAVVRPSLAMELVERIRQMILEGELEAGQKVPERRLTEQFGVSRTPLREAIKILAHEGFVALVPNRGSVVALDDEIEIDELFPIVAVLEGLAGELAAAKASDREIAFIAERTRDLRQSFETFDRNAYFKTNQAIHTGLITASKNAALVRQHDLASRRIFRARYQANLSRKRWQAAVEEHEAMLDALSRRDEQDLGKKMRAHIMEKFAAVRASRTAASS